MTGRQTILLLAALAALAGLARLYVGGVLDDTTLAREQQRGQYQELWETVDDLELRLSKILVSTTEEETLIHFQQQAVRANMGSVNTVTRERGRRGYTDRILTINFETGNPQFRRNQIVNFLYNSELLMPRMRSTRLMLRPAVGDSRRRQLTPGSERPDIWKVDELAFTQRSPVAQEREGRGR